ncbi:glycosyltransferase family 9 protein [Peredibacter starrii]|uniref:Glycosyltransferase family 9 protein n=1 Tax=Peredibacter starrii TaxID=28202 RepID=A0AAX4HW13_9BACT|nr:glycosyltransferase family 9 protein [Peredibacter starrii]WPU67201.1 glycosyltransferase family 9 protein [Peredibacter starrii]
MKIVILRALKLGDMICSIPALKAIRTHYPDAEISLVSLPSMKNLFERYSHLIDEFIPFSGFPGMPELNFSPNEVTRFLSDMQEREFDLAVQLHGSGEVSNELINLFGAKRCIGFHQGPKNQDYLTYPNDLHEVERCLALLEILEIEKPDPELEFPLSKEDKKMVLDLCLPSRYVCIHPGASTESKRWDRMLFSRLADEISDRGTKVVFTGSSNESELVQGIMKSMKSDAFDAASLNLPIGPLSALIQQSSGLICNDTGVSHISAALKKKSIVIFTETSPDRWAPLDGNLHRALVRPSLQEVIHLIGEVL